jgi:hypothetical protein
LPEAERTVFLRALQRLAADAVRSAQSQRP